MYDSLYHPVGINAGPQTFDIGDLLRQALAELAGQIKVAFVYGSIAKRTDTAGSDIDVMIIADNVSYSDLFSALAAIEPSHSNPRWPNP